MKTAAAITSAMAFAAALLLLPVTASACGCEGPSTPYLVARGKSVYGIPWRIRAGEGRFDGVRQATFGFNVGTREQPNDAGYFSTLRLPVARGFVLNASPGSGIDPRKEGDVSGVATRRAVRLTATMSQGPPLEIDVQTAPPVLRERHPWLRGLEFFDQWFTGDAQVERVTAYGRSGRVLEVVP
jgi:hypothetical protein